MYLLCFYALPCHIVLIQDLDERMALPMNPHVKPFQEDQMWLNAAAAMKVSCCRNMEHSVMLQERASMSNVSNVAEGIVKTHIHAGSFLVLPVHDLNALPGHMQNQSCLCKHDCREAFCPCKLCILSRVLLCYSWHFRSLTCTLRFRGYFWIDTTLFATSIVLRRAQASLSMLLLELLCLILGDTCHAN